MSKGSLQSCGFFLPISLLESHTTARPRCITRRTSGTSLFLLYWPSFNSYPWWSFSFHSAGLSHQDVAGWLAGAMSNSQTTKPPVYGFGLETTNIKHFSALTITRNLNIQGLLLREKEYLWDISRISLMCTTGS